MSVSARFGKVVFIGVCFVFSASAFAQTQTSSQQPQPATFNQKLREARYDLHIEGSRFTGTAAPVLESAITGAQYVLIGEDHITREVPQFTTAVCDVMGPQGFSTMVVEASPEVASFMFASLGKPDRVARMAALVRRNPDSVAFLNIRQENDLVNHCAQESHDPNFQLWGLDQPFIGSAGWLLGQILATHPGPDATAALNRTSISPSRFAPTKADSLCSLKERIFTSSKLTTSKRVRQPN